MSGASPSLSGEIRDGRHVLPVRVYYEDTDFTGLVYHASYLRFMERGRTDYLRLLGARQRTLFEETAREAPGFHFAVRSMTIEFLKPARMDDVIEVSSAPEEVKGASITLHQRIVRGPRPWSKPMSGSRSSPAAGPDAFRPRCGRRCGPIFPAATSILRPR